MNTNNTASAAGEGEFAGKTDPNTSSQRRHQSRLAHEHGSELEKPVGARSASRGLSPGTPSSDRRNLNALATQRGIKPLGKSIYARMGMLFVAIIRGAAWLYILGHVSSFAAAAAANSERTIRVTVLGQNAHAAYLSTSPDWLVISLNVAIFVSFGCYVLYPVAAALMLLFDKPSRPDRSSRLAPLEPKEETPEVTTNNDGVLISDNKVITGAGQKQIKDYAQSLPKDKPDEQKI